MSIQTAGTITIVAPALVDGRAGTAVLNNTADSSNFVGWLENVSGFGGAQVRTVSEDIPEGHGAVFGIQHYGARVFTMEAKLAIASTFALSDARRDRLTRAWNAMGADGTITWPDNDGYTKQISFRQEAPPGDPSGTDRIMLLGGRAADPRIYRTASEASASPYTNNGNASSPPTFTFTASGNGTVILTNSTTSEALTVTVGTGGVSTGSAVTVDFKNRTVTQGGTRKDYAVVFPGSTWWEVVPGANTWTRTGTATISVAAAIQAPYAWLNG